jgi:hypothetical protein
MSAHVCDVVEGGAERLQDASEVLERAVELGAEVADTSQVARGVGRDLAGDAPCDFGSATAATEYGPTGGRALRVKFRSFILLKVLMRS